MNEPVPVLTCVQVREDTIVSVVPGSIQGNCDTCGHRVWISRSGQAMMKTQEIKIGCLECIMGDLPKEEFLKDARIAPGALREVLDSLRRPNETR